MLSSNRLNLIETKPKVNQLLYELDLKKSIFEQRESILEQRKSEREIYGFGEIIEIRRQVIKEQLGEVIEAIIIDHSSNGCGLLIVSKQCPKLQDIYQLNTAKFDLRIMFITAKVVWSRKVDDGTCRLGLEYIDLVKK